MHGKKKTGKHFQRYQGKNHLLHLSTQLILFNIILFEKLLVAQMDKKFAAFYAIQRFIKLPCS
jgi:hypothetical protein